MRGLTLLMLFALVVGACSPADETSAEETTTTEATTSSEAEATTTTAEATTTTTEATTTTAATGGAGCLAGEWELDSEAFLEQLTSAMEEQAGGQDVAMEFVEGSYTISLGEDGSFTASRDEWTFQIVMSEGTFRATIDGTDTGTWEADEASITISNVESNSVISTQAEVNGQLVDIPQGTVPLTDTNAVGETATYTCSGDTLTVDSADGFVSELSRAG